MVSKHKKSTAISILFATMLCNFHIFYLFILFFLMKASQIIQTNTISFVLFEIKMKLLLQMVIWVETVCYDRTE